MSAFNTLKLSAKGLVNLALSITIAAPVQLWARDLTTTSGPTLAAGAAKDGVPFIYQEGQDAQGRSTFMFIAAVPEELERETILRMAGNDPKNLNLVVNGPDDPGFRAAMDSGNLDWINTYRAGTLEQSTVVRDETDVNLKTRVLNKSKEMWGNVKGARYGVMMAFGYAGVISVGSVYVQTASVTATIGTFIPMGLMAGFVASQSRTWLGMLNKSGDGAAALVAKVTGAFGGKLDAANKTAWRKAAMFGTTLAINGAQAKFVTAMSNEHLEYGHLMMLAFATNYAVWDLTVDRLVHQNKIDHKWEPRYFAFQLLAGTLAELAVYSHVPNVEAGLGVIVAAGLGYFVGGEKIESGVMWAKTQVRYKVDTAKGRVVAASNSLAEKTKSVKVGCEAFLGRVTKFAQVVKK